MRRVGMTLQESSDKVVPQELADLEWSSAPKPQKVSKPRHVHMKLDPCRPHRKRIVLDDVYSPTGEALSVDVAVSRAFGASSRLGRGDAAASRKYLTECHAQRLASTGCHTALGVRPQLLPEEMLEDIVEDMTQGFAAPSQLPDELALFKYF